MAEKNFLNWVGFKGEEDAQVKTTPAAGSQGLERIRELEAQLADLRSRRDITALTKEEFEILATETAMSMIRTAQQRETKANSTAERLLNESKRTANATVEAAESKAKTTLASAESRGRKYIEAAEGDAAEILSKAEEEAKQLLESRNREANSITANAKRVGQKIILDATTEVSEYRSWLAGVISEAERLYRVQAQSLDSAESAITQSRQKLENAFSRLQDLQRTVTDALSPDGTPTRDTKVAARIAASAVQSTASEKASGGKSKSTAKEKKKRTATKKRR